MKSYDPNQTTSRENYNLLVIKKKHLSVSDSFSLFTENADETTFLERLRQIYFNKVQPTLLKFYYNR